MPSNTTSALIGGLSTAVLVTLLNLLTLTGNVVIQTLLGCLSCLVYLCAGLIAVWHYTTEYSLTLTGRQGVTLGLFSGAIAGATAAIIQHALVMVGIMPGPEEAMAASGVSMDQPGMEVAKIMIEMMSGTTGLVITIVLGVIFGGLLGLAGGAIGRSIWKKGDDEGVIY